MIYRIDDSNKNFSLNVKPNVNSQAYLRINALYKAYGTSYNFIDFYTNTDNTIFLCIKNNFADIYIDKDFTEVIELNNFLYLKASEMITELPIDINVKSVEIGNIYELTNPIFDRVGCVGLGGCQGCSVCTQSDISNEIVDCYEVAKEIFPLSINENSYPVWYTDLSHRVRHNMSITYTIKDISTVTAYAMEAGIVLISYLGTVKSKRNQGYATLLLNHISKELKATKFILQSQDEKSDNFYKKLGFIQEGNYYNYVR